MKQRPLRVPFDPLASATAAFRRGDFEFALRAVESQQPTTKAHCLRSSILRRMNRPQEAHDAAEWAVAAAQDDEDRALAACTMATSLSVLKRPEEALVAIAEADDLRYRVSDFTRGRVGFTRALMAWGAGDAEAAEREMLEAYRCADPHERMCSRQLHAFVCFLREEHDKACEMLVMALAEHDKAPSAPWEAQIIANISFLSSELATKVNLNDMRRRIRALPWTPGLHEHRFWAHRNFGLRLVTEGGLSTQVGITFLRQGQDFAVTLAQKAMATLDSAQAAFHVEEREHAEAFLSQGVELLGKVDWAKESGDERFSLLAAAEMLAPKKPAEAATLLETFRTLPPMGYLQAFSHGNRLPAMLAHAEGVVARWSGEKDRAVERFTFALEAFEEIKYRWRAAEACFELHMLTENALYRARGEELLNGDYRESWLRMLLKSK